MSQANPRINLTPAAAEFIESVIASRPRVAAFDCDGTLWAGDAGAEFFYWALDRGLVPERVAAWARRRYSDYKKGLVSEEAMCGEMVTIHEGVGDDELYAAAEEFFAARKVSEIFPEMLELTRRLREAGCQLWAVSSTNEWVIRAGARRFGIPDDHILAACVHCENGLATGRLRMVPTDEDKAVAIRNSFGGSRASASLLDAAFGNSIHDLAMLELAARPFPINANPDLQRIAQQRGWPIYFPMGTAAHNPAP
jgi:phosphoserine phosphatase